MTDHHRRRLAIAAWALTLALVLAPLVLLLAAGLHPTEKATPVSAPAASPGLR